MTFTCPLCRTEYLFVSKLCDRCDRIRYVMSLYSREKVLEVIEKVFLIDKFKEKVNEADDQKDYEKQPDGTWKKVNEDN